jgi:hypothetical protein
LSPSFYKAQSVLKKIPIPRKFISNLSEESLACNDSMPDSAPLHHIAMLPTIAVTVPPPTPTPRVALRSDWVVMSLGVERGTALVTTDTAQSSPTPAARRSASRLALTASPGDDAAVHGRGMEVEIGN